jgi:hypothetical protein
MLSDQVIANGSLRGEDAGFRFGLRMPWYRALPLSSLEGLDVRIDGEEIPSETLELSLGGRTYGLSDLPPLHDEWWYVADPIEVRAETQDPLPEGEHELDVTIALRIPYIVESGHPLVMRERCVTSQATGGA